jgi:hypothetical protein
MNWRNKPQAQITTQLLWKSHPRRTCQCCRPQRCSRHRDVGCTSQARMYQLSGRRRMQRMDRLAQRTCERGIGKQKQNFSLPGSSSSSSSSDTPGVACGCTQVQVNRQLHIDASCRYLAITRMLPATEQIGMQISPRGPCLGSAQAATQQQLHARNRRTSRMPFTTGWAKPTDFFLVMGVLPALPAAPFAWCPAVLPRAFTGLTRPAEKPTCRSEATLPLKQSDADNIYRFRTEFWPMPI